MAKPSRRPFRWAVDTSVLIAHLNGNDKIRGKDASAYSRGIFERAEVGEARIIVSALTLVEVWKPHPKANPFTPPTNLESFDAILTKSWLEIVEVGRACGLLSRKLSQDLNIPSWDAVHVASAILGEAETLYCWDRDDLLKHGEIMGVKVAEPPAIALPNKRPPTLDQSRLSWGEDN